VHRFVIRRLLVVSLPPRPYICLKPVSQVSQMESAELKNRINQMSRDELNVVARKLNVKGYRKKKQNDLVEHLLSEHTEGLASMLNVTWWDIYHNHVYGVGSLALAVIGILIALPLFSESDHEFECAIESASPLIERANTVFDGTDIENWKPVSTSEISTFVVRLVNNSARPASIEKGTIVVEGYVDPLDGKTPIKQLKAYQLMDHSDHHIATLGKLTNGESGLFPMNTIVPAKSSVEIPVWVRLIDKERPVVTFLDSKIRLYSTNGDWIETDVLRMEIHKETERFAGNDIGAE